MQIGFPINFWRKKYCKWLIRNLIFATFCKKERSYIEIKFRLNSARFIGTQLPSNLLLPANMEPPWDFILDVYLRNVKNAGGSHHTPPITIIKEKKERLEREGEGTTEVLICNDRESIIQRLRNRRKKLKQLTCREGTQITLFWGHRHTRGHRWTRLPWIFN